MIRMTAVIDTKGIQDTFAGIEQEIAQALSAEADKIMTLYQATISNWKRKPKFEKSVSVNRDEAYAVVGTDNDIYRFLHDGTSERWALMSDDFQPKTFPRVLGVGPGQGKAILRGRSQFGSRPAQPGIKAREWTQEIIKREQKNFEKNMQAAFDKAIGKS